MKKLTALFLVILLLTGCTSLTLENDKTQEPSPEAIFSMSDTEMEDIAVALVTDISKGEYEKAYKDYPYDSAMLKIINADFFKDQFWGYLISVYGEFKEIKWPEANEYKGYRIVSVRTSFEKSNVNLNIVFDKDGKIAGINQAPYTDKPDESAPEGVVEKEVSFGKTGWELSATLTIPEGNKAYPVVILVHGSGPNDRDETVGPNKPFRDIAWGLAKKGIASLRYDKRTYLYGVRMAADPNLTVYQEAVEDAGLAVQYLKLGSDITPGKIYISGHSLGGMLMPRIANEAPQADGYIILSGPVTPLEDIMVEQINYLSNLDSSISNEEKQTITAYETMRDNVKSLSENSKLTADKLFSIPPAYWLDIKGYKPDELAKSIEKPLLILQGERDYQVTMREFELWKNALGNKENVTLKSYEGLNHLLIKGNTKSTPDEYNIPGKVDDRIIEDISSWILDQ